MIEIKMQFMWNQGSEMRYGANAECDIPSASSEQVGCAIISLIGETCEAMTDNARCEDFVGIDNKVIQLVVVNGHKSASIEMVIRRDDDIRSCSNSIIDWILGSTVEEVLT